MIKVFIIDDHQMIIEGIRTLLTGENNIEWTGSAKTPSALMEALKTKQPDVLLMDINLPEINGLELCKTVKQKYPHIHVIGLSTSSEASIIKKMMDNGASGYLLKDALGTEIIAALQAVVKGKEYVNFSVSEILKSYKTETASLPVLTRREKEILELISEGLTNQEIAQKLFVTVTTVDSHRKNMLTKFNVKNTAALVKIAIVNKLI